MPDVVPDVQAIRRAIGAPTRHQHRTQRGAKKETATKVAIYARVSTTDQTCENQLLELRRYCQARGWTIAREFVDHAVSGAKESPRPWTR